MQETDFENRIVSTEFSPSDGDLENSLRPKQLSDYIGQDKVKETFPYISKQQRAEAKRLTMFCFTDLPVSAKQRLRALLQMRWA